MKNNEDKEIPPNMVSKLIDVTVNGKPSTISAMRINEVVYFSEEFIKKNYEFYGELENGKYHFKHNNGIFRDVFNYDFIGNYLNFHFIHVENWSNYFDGYSIPVNNFRWGEYYYPISIIHYGLSHYCQYLSKQHLDVDEDIDFYADLWRLYSGENNLLTMSKDIIFSGFDNAYELKVLSTKRYINVEATFSNSDFRIYLEVNTTEGVKEIHLGYGTENKKINDKSYYVGIPADIFMNNRLTLFRDLETDVKKMFDCRFLELVSIKIRGDIRLHQLTSNNVNHKKIIQRVADWLVREQDDNGGWASDFDHTFYKGRTDVMKSGWYSAMAQGLAISHLIRAHYIYKNPKYLEIAKKALHLYSIPVSEGGVLSYINSMPIYEEYPTIPDSHVLNGFIFSLLGLYDLYKYTGDLEAKELFNRGILTLEHILPMYDMGNRSAYDLTHITAQTYPNIARWAYHATHVHQLQTLMSICDSKIITEFYDRWYKYAFGFRVKTN